MKTEYDLKVEQLEIAANQKAAQLEEYFEAERKGWKDKMTPLYAALKGDHKDLIDTQALQLSYRHMAMDEATKLLTRLSKEMVKKKGLERESFLYYATGFGLKTSNPEKTKLIDSDLAERTRIIELIQEHIEYLREMIKLLDQIGYAIKNRVSIFNYLGN